MLDETSNLHVCVCLQKCVAHVTPFFLYQMLFCLLVLRQYCVEKNTHSHSDASVKGGCLLIHQACIHQSQSSLSPF